MAVRNEERAFSFWSYVVAHAQNSDVRRAAEAMASEELEHVAKLRRERRRAYHAERSVTSGKSVANDDLSVLELRLAERLDAFATDLDQDNAARVHGLANETRAIADELIRKPLTMPRRAASEPIPGEAVALSEFLVDRYLEAAEHVADEQSMLRAQTLARRAIDRLSSLRADLPELHGLRDVLSATKSES
jgi:rubrerythrin